MILCNSSLVVEKLAKLFRGYFLARSVDDDEASLPWGYLADKKFQDIFSRLDTIQDCGGQTDWQIPANSCSTGDAGTTPFGMGGVADPLETRPSFTCYHAEFRKMCVFKPTLEKSKSESVKVVNIKIIHWHVNVNSEMNENYSN